MLAGTLGLTLDDTAPPLVHGAALLAGMLYAGRSFGDMLDLIGPAPGQGPALAAWLMDRSWAYALNFAPYQAAEFQLQALALHQVFRVRGTAGHRLLALAAPGGLMVNAPLDFIAGPAAVRLDIAFVQPGGLPASLPDHDVAMIAASESAPDALDAMACLFRVWPRPILNDPRRIRPMSRSWLPVRLNGLAGLTAAPAREVSRAELAGDAPGLLPGGTYPLLLRPLGSHAGHGLECLAGPAAMAGFLAGTSDDAFTLTQFVDYRSPDGLFRKYRIAFVAGRPFICHMAASEHWMVHYLNAGMDSSPAKRAAEAEAMACFGQFCRRHATALDALVEAIGLDYFSIDCAEVQDGRLLVFEADTAAIIHSMDPPELYPYKRPVMQRCYDAFGAMIRDQAARLPPPAPPPAPSSAPVPALA